MVDTLQHGHPLLAFEHLAHEVARERPEHHQIDDTDLDAAFLAHVVGHRFGCRNQAALTYDQVVGIVATIVHHAAVTSASEFMELVESPLRELLNVIEEIRPLSGHALHIGVLVLHWPGQERVVHRPEFRYAPAPVSVNYFLSRSRRIYLVVGFAEIFRNQFALGKHQRFNQVCGQETVLADNARRQCQLGNAV